jgi:hypothetical protein
MEDQRFNQPHGTWRLASYQKVDVVERREREEDRRKSEERQKKGERRTRVARVLTSLLRL